ncbi:MAG: hypothetical protein ACD_3C00200G0003 [uncultured bacterium (gcode 4)]|uniref:Uncharacterized protein n=1 Tax=uncultured bacterium (gcode 4) TaxID=1234023 RepID=K2GBC1_9BACT|nr:MAG: hypothetical protein ACD_3C00200G0003 [uncultured bacterium (gcode 4)]
MKFLAFSFLIVFFSNEIQPTIIGKNPAMNWTHNHTHEKVIHFSDPITALILSKSQSFACFDASISAFLFLSLKSSLNPSQSIMFLMSCLIMDSSSLLAIFRSSLSISFITFTLLNIFNVFPSISLFCLNHSLNFSLYWTPQPYENIQPKNVIQASQYTPTVLFFVSNHSIFAFSTVE